jgi:hypothetical protein
MIFAITMFLTALLISVVAAYYSIAGLTAIFAAAVIPVIIMGATLELGKVVATVWLHNNWKQINWVYKTYLIPAIVFLMILTSMGIFGFLSKAHSDQSLVSGDSMAKVVIYDEKIKIERENIANAQQVIKQMDAAVNGVIATGDQEIKLRDGTTRIRSAAERSLQIRRSQAKDRQDIIKQIEVSQTKIVQLQEERAPLAAEFRKIEAEVGPIKYIAAFIYGDNPNASVLEKAVTWVIILIVIVFDPLALCLILAANKQMGWIKEDREKKYRSIVEQPVFEKVEEPVEEVVEEIPLSDDIPQPEPVDPYAYLKKPFKHFENLKPMVAPVVKPKEEMVEIKKDNMIVIDDITGETIPSITHEKVTIETHNTQNSIMYEEHHIPVKTLEPKYDYEEPYSFKEKEVRDAGKF